MTNRAFGGHRQQGMILIIALIFLLVMTVIGVTAMQTTSLDERMASNLRDRNLAFQAAEAALRDAERDVSNQVAGYARGISGFTNFTANCGASTTGSDADDGLCKDTTAYTTPIWTTTSMTAAPSVQYGRFTHAASISGVSAQPRYIIEGIEQTVTGCSDNRYYRITVRAQGASANTVVWLQSTYGCKP